MMRRHNQPARFVAPDGEGMLTLWEDNSASPFGPSAMLRHCESNGPVWEAIIHAYGEPVCGDTMASPNGGNFVCYVPHGIFHDACEGTDRFGDCAQWEAPREVRPGNAGE